MNRPRRHHFVPRFYLNGFCAESSRTLAACDRALKMFRAQRPVEVAHRRDYYAYEDEQGGLIFDIEALDQVEAAASGAIAKVDNDEELAADDNISLATYAAFQFTRTPAYAEWIAPFRAHWAHDARHQVGEFLPETVDPVAAREQAIGAMLRHAPGFAQVFLQLNWTIWRCEFTRTSFVTTDSPVSVMWTNGREANGYAGVGILSPDVVTVLPLSQRSGLAMSGLGNRVDRRLLARDQVRRINLAVVNQSQHFVFGRDMTLVENLVRTTGFDKRPWQVPLLVG